MMINGAFVVNRWAKPIEIVNKSGVFDRGVWIETETTNYDMAAVFRFDGNKYPEYEHLNLSTEDITVYSTNNICNIEDVVIVNSTRYKVLVKKDYTRNSNFFMYIAKREPIQ